jgi:hypothetical protein
MEKGIVQCNEGHCTIIIIPLDGNRRLEVIAKTCKGGSVRISAARVKKLQICGHCGSQFFFIEFFDGTTLISGNFSFKTIQVKIVNEITGKRILLYKESCPC